MKTRSIHATSEEKNETKDRCYEELENMHDEEVLVGDAHAKVGKEDVNKKFTGGKIK